MSNSFFLAACATSAYKKSDGKYYCGFTIKDSLNWFQAIDACKLRGGKLPEFSSFSENLEVLKLKVSVKLFLGKRGRVV